MNKFDRKNCDAVAAAILKAANETLRPMGLAAVRGPGRFSDTNFQLKIDVGFVNGAGALETKERQLFRDVAHMINMKPEDLGREFTVGGERYTIEGFRAGRARRRLLARRWDNKPFVFDSDVVARALGYTVPSPPSFR